MKSIMKSNGGAMPQPFSGIIDNFLHNNLSRFLDDDFWGSGSNALVNRAPVNIRETDKTYELDLMAPGLKKEDFRIRMDNKVLTVAFERKEENKEEDQNGKVLRSEFRHESFSRSFNLGDTVDPSGITARYADGILHLVLPKKEEAQRMTREITIE